MKFKQIFEKNRRNWPQEKEIEVSQGKQDTHPATKIFVFAPLALVISCLVVILGVVGIPTTMDAFKDVLDSVYGNHQELKQAAPELLFEDINNDSSYYDALAYLKKHGIISGFQDNTFKPELALKRAELLKIIVNAKKQYPLALNYNNCFADVKNDWYAPVVCFAREKGWIASDKGSYFRPEDDLTRAEALKILIKAFEINKAEEGSVQTFEDVLPESWYYEYVQIAQTRGLLSADPTTDLFGPEEPAGRGETAKVIYRVLQL